MKIQAKYYKIQFEPSPTKIRMRRQALSLLSSQGQCLLRVLPDQQTRMGSTHWIGYKIGLICSDWIKMSLEVLVSPSQGQSLLYDSSFQGQARTFT